MKLGIIAVTEKGVLKALKIKENIKNCDIFTMEKFLRKDVFLIEGKLQSFYGSILEKYNTFLFITATGIAVNPFLFQLYIHE